MDFDFKRGGASNFKRAYRVWVLKDETKYEGKLMLPADDELLNWHIQGKEEDCREDSPGEPQGIQALEHHPLPDDDFRAVAQGDGCIACCHSVHSRGKKRV